MICIAGKNNIAVEITKYVKDMGLDNEICVVLNRNDEGIDGFQRSLKKFAVNNNIKICTLEDIYDVEDILFLSLEFDRIVKPEKFKTDRLFNIHFSLLPRYKGMYTSYWPIRNGENLTGVTLHKIDSGIDTGEIIAQRKIEIKNNCSCKDMYLNYISNGIELVKENIENLICKFVTSEKQDPSKSTYYSKGSIDYSNLNIDFNNTANDIKNQIRAIKFRDYQMPKINNIEVSHCIITSEKSNLRPGNIILEDDSIIKMATVDYNIIIYKDKIEEILEACRIGNIKKIREYIKNGYDINDQNKIGWTPLIVSAYNGKLEIVKALVSNGADVNLGNYKGTTPLMYAKDYCIRNKCFDIVKILIINKADILKRDYNDKNIFYYINKNYGQDELNNFISEIL